MENTQGLPELTKKSSEKMAKEKPSVKLSKTLSEIADTYKNINSENLPLEQLDKLEEIRKNVIRSGRKLAITIGSAVGAGVLIGGIAMGVEAAYTTVNYEANRFVLTETVDANGQAIYLHPDARTTHYLNILAGKEKFTEDDLMFAGENTKSVDEINKIAGAEKYTDAEVEEKTKEQWIGRFKENADFHQNPPNMEKMSSEELAIAYSSQISSSASVEDIIEYNKVLKKMFNERANYVSSNKGMYKLVWELEQEGGNPKIRLIGKDGVSGNPNKNAFYVPSNNTMYVDIKHLTGDLVYPAAVVSETSHGKQWADRAFISSLLVIRDNGVASVRSLFSGSGFWAEHDKLYYEPGTLEYQAHKVIQPALEEKYPIISEDWAGGTKKANADQNETK